MKNIENIELYKLWAPDDTAWSAWAKPVLFASLPAQQKNSAAVAMVPRTVSFLPDARAMVIVDLPGPQGVEEALGFAVNGWRPVPLYNGVMGPGRMQVDVRPLAKALYFGADTLRGLALPPGAPPVFMLDSNRMQGARMPETFDNRWCVFPQDMPSARYIKDKGITKIVLRSGKTRPDTDLARILYDYQKAGLALQLLNENEAFPKALTVKKQSALDEWAYRLKVILKLKRNAAGGFGGAIPAPYEQSGAGTYYRMG